VDEADDENAETVYETEMEMLRHCHMSSGALSRCPPQGNTLSASRAISAGGQGGNKLPPLHRHQQGNKVTMRNYNTRRQIAIWTSFVERFETSVEIHPQTGS
jgi:hypothetical protein